MFFEVHQIAIVVIFAIFLIGPARVYGHLSGISIFLYAQTIMGLGIIPRLDPLIEADRVHARIIVVTLLLYTITALVAGIVRSSQGSLPAPVVQIDKPRAGTWFLLVLSIVISALYFAAIGYVAFFETLKGAFGGEEVDAATLRLESYSGDTYYFPGYVNQFKNSLLPALVVIVVHYLLHMKTPGRITLAITLVTTSTIFLLGTGQRGAFVTFVIIALLYAWLASRPHFRMALLVVGVFATALFFLSTIASGRASADLEAAESPLEKVGVLFSQLVGRFTGSNQGSAVAGFRYIYDGPIQYGGDWYRSLKGLLPGVSGSSLDSEIFATIYGSTRGTSPPSVWGSVYYNFGEIGCVVLAIAFALILAKVSTLGTSQSVINTTQAIGLAGINVITGSWIAGSPAYLFNLGLMVYILMWLYGKRKLKREHKDILVTSSLRGTRKAYPYRAQTGQMSRIHKDSPGYSRRR